MTRASLLLSTVVVLACSRVAGKDDAYGVDGRGWSVSEAPRVGPGLRPVGGLDFKGTFVTAQHGAIVAGDPLAIDYDLGRLTTCRATHNGYRFWSLDAW